MRRPKSEKILIGCLMATGLFASVFGVLRLVMLLGDFQDRGMVWLQVRSDLLCGIELMVATIAASLPCLKGPTERVLNRFGVHLSSHAAHPDRYEQITFDSLDKRRIDELPLTNFDSSTNKSQDLGVQTSSQYVGNGQTDRMI